MPLPCNQGFLPRSRSTSIIHMLGNAVMSGAPYQVRRKNRVMQDRQRFVHHQTGDRASQQAGPKRWLCYRLRAASNTSFGPIHRMIGRLAGYSVLPPSRRSRPSTAAACQTRQLGSAVVDELEASDHFGPASATSGCWSGVLVPRAGGADGILLCEPGRQTS